MVAMPSAIFHYDNHEFYSFEELPKKDVLSLNINPYNGNCVLSYSNHPLALEVAHQLLEQVHDECAMLESFGSVDPLHDFVKLCNGDKAAMKALRDAQEKAAIMERMDIRTARRINRSLNVLNRKEVERC